MLDLLTKPDRTLIDARILRRQQRRDAEAEKEKQKRITAERYARKIEARKRRAKIYVGKPCKYGHGKDIGFQHRRSSDMFCLVCLELRYKGYTMNDIAQMSEVGVTDADIQQVETMAGMGLTLEQIAAVKKWSLSALIKHKQTLAKLDEAIHRGLSRAAMNVSRALYDRAMLGDVNAIRWWEQTRLRNVGRNTITALPGEEEALTEEELTALIRGEAMLDQDILDADYTKIS